MAGLLLDRIVEAEVVLADGSLVTASSTSNPDLFWVRLYRLLCINIYLRHLLGTSWSRSIFRHRHIMDILHFARAPDYNQLPIRMENPTVTARCSLCLCGIPELCGFASPERAFPPGFRFYQ